MIVSRRIQHRDRPADRGHPGAGAERTRKHKAARSHFVHRHDLRQLDVDRRRGRHRARQPRRRNPHEIRNRQLNETKARAESWFFVVVAVERGTRSDGHPAFEDQIGDPNRKLGCGLQLHRVEHPRIGRIREIEDARRVAVGRQPQAALQRRMIAEVRGEQVRRERADDARRGDRFDIRELKHRLHPRHRRHFAFDHLRSFDRGFEVNDREIRRANIHRDQAFIRAQHGDRVAHLNRADRRRLRDSVEHERWLVIHHHRSFRPREIEPVKPLRRGPDQRVIADRSDRRHASLHDAAALALILEGAVFEDPRIVGIVDVHEDEAGIVHQLRRSELRHSP